MYVIKHNIHFYRAKLRVSAVFAVARCPSVRTTLVQLCLVYSQTAEDIVILLVRPGSPIILVFYPHAPIPDSKIQWEPLQRGCKIQDGWEIQTLAIYDWNRRLSRKRCQIGHWLLRNVNGNPRWRIDTCRFRWLWEWPLTRISRSRYFSTLNWPISETTRDRAIVTIERQ